MGTPGISLVTTCKGRLAFLQHSLSTWMTLDYPAFEIIVVDYDSPDGTAAWIERHRGDLLASSMAADLRVVRVEDRPRFNLNEARNLGIAAAASEWVLVIDSDMDVMDRSLLTWIAREIRGGRDFLSHMQVLTTYYPEAREFYRRRFGVDRFPGLLVPLGVPMPSMTGTACFRKSLWETCGAYDPEVNKRGYGLDDYDFYLRYLNHPAPGRRERPSRHEHHREHLDQLLARTAVFPDGALHHTEHSDEDRERFYQMDLGASNRGNEEFIRSFFGNAGRRVPDATAEHLHGEVYRAPSTPARPLAPWLEWWYPYWLGGRLAADGEWHRASILLAQALRHRAQLPDTTVADILTKLGDALLRRGHQIRARTLRRRALDILRGLRAPMDSDRFLRAVTAQALGYPEEAREEFTILCSRPSPTPRQLYVRASTAQQSGLLDIARDAFNRLSDHQEYGAGALFHLGQISEAEGNQEDARRSYRQCLDREPRHQAAALRMAALTLSPRQAA